MTVGREFGVGGKCAPSRRRRAARHCRRAACRPAAPCHRRAARRPAASFCRRAAPLSSCRPSLSSCRLSPTRSMSRSEHIPSSSKDSSSLPRFEDRRSRPPLFTNAFAINATHPALPPNEDDDAFLRSFRRRPPMRARSSSPVGWPSPLVNLRRSGTTRTVSREGSNLALFLPPP